MDLSLCRTSCLKHLLACTTSNVVVLSYMFNFECEIVAEDSYSCRNVWKFRLNFFADILLQHFVASFCCNILLQHCCNILLQHFALLMHPHGLLIRSCALSSSAYGRMLKFLWFWWWISWRGRKKGFLFPCSLFPDQALTPRHECYKTHISVYVHTLKVSY